MLDLNSRKGFDFITRYNRLADLGGRPGTPKGGSPLHAPSGIRYTSASLAGRAEHEGVSEDTQMDAISRETVCPLWGAFPRDGGGPKTSASTKRRNEFG
ncbi:hypothetical protein ES703_85431 [subsurface metagenome]